MTGPMEQGGRASFAKRYGALIAILVVAALVITVVALKGGSSKQDSAASTSTTTASGPVAGVTSWSEAKAEGKTASIDWGSRCNTETGTLAYPSYWAAPCYAPFSGDNGGSTAQGVTATEIKVVEYFPQDNDPVLNYINGAIDNKTTNAQAIPTMQRWVEFYNHYFETYGRKVVMVPFVATGASNDAVAARADAVTIATNLKPFAVWGGPALTTAFADELSARKVLVINGGAGNSYDYFNAHAPYLYTLGMIPQQSLTHTVNYLSKQVAGRKASFAGSVDLRAKTRRFGLITLTDSDQAAKEYAQLMASFKKAKVPVVSHVTYASPVDLQTGAPALIAKLRAAGATSIIFAGDPIAPQPLTRAATAQNFFPEWIQTGITLTDLDAFGRTYDQRQWAHAFGVSALVPRIGDSANASISLYRWYFGQDPPDQTGAAIPVGSASLFFPRLQVIGPKLTVPAFRNALFSAPRAKQALTQPLITYGNRGIWPKTDYAGTDDMAEVWWNPKAVGIDEIGRRGAGMYEYVDGGKRYLPNAWPTTPTKAFDPKGAVTSYQQAPAGEAPPSYPSPKAAG